MIGIYTLVVFWLPIEQLWKKNIFSVPHSIQYLHIEFRFIYDKLKGDCILLLSAPNMWSWLPLQLYRCRCWLDVLVNLSFFTYFFLITFMYFYSFGPFLSQSVIPYAFNIQSVRLFCFLVSNSVGWLVVIHLVQLCCCLLKQNEKRGLQIPSIQIVCALDYWFFVVYSDQKNYRYFFSLSHTNTDVNVTFCCAYFAYLWYQFQFQLNELCPFKRIFFVTILLFAFKLLE